MLPDSSAIPQLSAPALKARLDRGERMILLDVREDDERSLCAIPAPATATDWHVPMNQLANRLPELHALAASAPLVVYCHLGVRSMAAARWLVRQGIEGVMNLDGGIDAWSVHVDPSVPRY